MKTKIVRVPILPFGMVNCHLLVGEHGCVLVDAGLPGSAGKIGSALRQCGRNWEDLKLIVITHAHVDHAGSAAEIRSLSGAPILASDGDLDYYARRRPMTFCDTGWFGKLFLKTGLILQPYEGFTPGILLRQGESVDLQAYGVAGKAVHTPGHTAGSVSVLLDDGNALVGDLLASGMLLGGLIRTGRAIRPPFEDDPAQVARQLGHLLAAGCNCFYMGHGGPLPADETRRHAERLATLARGDAQ
ncbi:MBL fold metallo-hydrolase [Rugamonas fusca]|uniref:MBL fold metallo-hydrolase n=1 Tax=Rugamonas fusca TaxID=2758568 RepID=UPI001E5D6B0A|nr:MBL fold metallo-hydrolase [Rugamonas fusca]